MQTANHEAAANRLLNAQRTGCQKAINQAAAYNNYYQRQAQVNAAIQREADRQHAIGAAGREADRQMGYHSPSHL